MPKKLDSKLKTALDETRLLFPGGQVLLGFQFQAFFQDGFSTLSSQATYLSPAGLALMVVSIALLVAPVMQHRLVESGRASSRLPTTVFAAASLAPLGLSLALATYVVIGRRYGTAAGVMSGLVMGGACAPFFGSGAKRLSDAPNEGPTPLPTKVEQPLTEARVIIPGGQALFASVQRYAYEGFRPVARWLATHPCRRALFHRHERHRPDDAGGIATAFHSVVRIPKPSCSSAARSSSSRRCCSPWAARPNVMSCSRRLWKMSFGCGRKFRWMAGHDGVLVHPSPGA